MISEFTFFGMNVPTWVIGLSLRFFEISLMLLALFFTLFIIRFFSCNNVTSSVIQINQPSEIIIDTDYFGKKRNSKNTSPGPFCLESKKPILIKIWPKN